MPATVLRSLGLAVSLAACLVAHAAKEPEVDLTGYRRATSPHATVLGKVPDDVLRAAALALEVVHDELSRVTALGGGAARFRVDVTLLGEGDGIRIVGGDSHFQQRRSAFAPTTAYPRIALFAPSSTEVVERTARESVHAFLALHVGPVPSWLEEALADYFSTLRLGIDTAALGSIVEAHRTALREQGPAPVSELLALDPAATALSPRHSATAWALVHLLATGREPAPHQLGDVLRRLASREPVAEAIVRGTGRTTDALDAQVRAMAAREVLPVRVRALPHAAASLPVSDVAREEMTARVIEDHAQVSADSPELQTVIRTLREQAPNAPSVRLAMGLVDAGNGRLELAAQELRRALELGSTEPRLHWRLGQVLVELATAGKDAHVSGGALLAEARGHLEKVVAAFPRCQVCWVQLAQAHLADAGDPARGAQSLERAIALGEHRHGLLMTLGALRMSQGDHEGGCRAFEGAMSEGSGAEVDEARAQLVRCHLTSADALWESDRDAESLPHYEKAAALTRDEEERRQIQEHIAEIRADVTLVDLAGEFMRAVERADRGDVAGAIPILERVAAQAEDPYLRDVARERLARYRSKGAAKPRP